MFVMGNVLVKFNLHKIDRKLGLFLRQHFAK